MALDVTGIVGLDLSYTRTGIARWGLKPKTEFFHDTIEDREKDKKTNVERALWIAGQITLLTMKADLIFIEDYAFGKPNRATMLGELGGIVKVVMLKHTRLEPFIVPIGTWKKFLCGKGTLEQAAFMSEVMKKHKIEPKTHDDAAAIAICDFARCLLQTTKIRKLKKYELDLIKKYRKEHPELMTRLQSLAKKGE